LKEKKRHAFLEDKKTVLLLMLTAAAAAFGITWAFYSSTQAMANPLTTGHSGAAIVEEFDPAASFLPGETVVKKVGFANTGEMRLLLRVKVPPTEGWYEGAGQPTESWYEGVGQLTESQGFDTGKVIKNWTRYWPDYEGSEPGDPQWTVGGDGYYYYNKILNPRGEDGDHTEDILAGITLDPSVSNDRHDVNYSDKTYVLTFDAEAVPVDEGFAGAGNLWGMTVSYDGTKLIWTKQGAGQ